MCVCFNDKNKIKNQVCFVLSSVSLLSVSFFVHRQNVSGPQRVYQTPVRIVWYAAERAWNCNCSWQGDSGRRAFRPSIPQQKLTIHERKHVHFIL